MTAETAAPRHAWTWRHFLALITGNIALALGPWSVRLSDAGPVATGFWRLALALPALAMLAVASGQPLTGFQRRTWFAVAGAGVFFAADLGAWHLGIHGTRLGNATLFGNSERNGMSIFAAYLFSNNAQVSILAFALGFAFGIPSMLLLIQNMGTLGAMLALVTHCEQRAQEKHG